MTRKAIKKINDLQIKLTNLVEEKNRVCDQAISLGPVTKENAKMHHSLEIKFDEIIEEIKNLEDEIWNASQSKSRVDLCTRELVSQNID